MSDDGPNHPLRVARRRAVMSLAAVLTFFLTFASVWVGVANLIDDRTDIPPVIEGLIVVGAALVAGTTVGALVGVGVTLLHRSIWPETPAAGERKCFAQCRELVIPLDPEWEPTVTNEGPEMSDHKWAVVRRSGSFAARALFGVVVGLSAMALLTSIVTPETLPKSVGQNLILVGLLLMCASAAAGVLATLGLGYATDCVFRPLGPDASTDTRLITRWRLAVVVYGVLAGGVMLVVLAPVLIQQVERFGPVAIGLIAGAVGVAAAKPRTPQIVTALPTQSSHVAT